jgi:YD repeat-containing protein
MPSRLRRALIISATIIGMFFTLVLPSFSIASNYIYDDANRLIRIEYEDGSRIEYAYDESGNRTKKTTQAVDATAPVTTATPAGGTFGFAQTVTLTCNDGTGSGCEKIYYTTDGSIPTTASPVYTAPIAIAATTTLKFFAMDLAGNAEAVKIQTYTVTAPNHLRVTVRKDAQNPLEGVNVYLFSEAGSYLGMSRMTNVSGVAVFDLIQQGTYKIRADYLGYQFWSAVVQVPTTASIDITIPHHTASITVNSLFHGAATPLQGLNVYLFTPAGSYLGLSRQTGSDGRASFTLPDKGYKVRTDYLGQQYFSTIFNAQDSAINIPMADAEVTVTAGSQVLSYVHVHVFTATGSYLGISGETDAFGKTSFRLPEGSYKFRVDYLGSQFWSETVTMPAVSSVAVTIPTTRVEVTVPFGTGIKVYVFSESGSYLGLYGETDASGSVSFNLPTGQKYRFRADLLGSLYWSDVVQITGSTVINVAIVTGGGLFTVTVRKDASNSMPGINVYLFNGNNTYLGMTRVSNAAGMVGFNVPQGVYKVRADYLDYQFWSDSVPVAADTRIDLMIPHQAVNITVNGTYQGTPTPISGIPVYLFSAGDAYLNQNRQTDGNGRASFTLPGKDYKARADYLGQQYFSAVFNSQDAAVSIPMADVVITVTESSRVLSGAPVYVFTTSGTYLEMTGTTNGSGQVTFRLPAGSYKFRADYMSTQYWSSEEVLAADQMKPVAINTGGGTFTLAVMEGASDPLTGVSCYVFSEARAYLGLSGTTGSSGQVSYDLTDGRYKFRVDHLGYQFWSDIYDVPNVLSGTFSIPHRNITVAVEGVYQGSQPLAGLNVYLFTQAGSYLRKSQVTDANGQVTFTLPDKQYKVRADYLASQFWSNEFQFADATVSIQRGVAQVIARKAGRPMSGLTVYLFSESGSYLRLNDTTNAEGKAEFLLPNKSYKFRVDAGGAQHWSAVMAITAGQVNPVEVNWD